MIISASRRTDIPALYSEWMINRINNGYVYVKNPVNTSQIKKISLCPDDVDCIVFWSKNPAPMLDKLPLLANYHYYFQFTLTPYGNDIEMFLPEKKEIVTTFKKLSDIIGPRRIIWRYDPVLLNNVYTMTYHIDMFSKYARLLAGYTEKVIFSFIDFYKKNTVNVLSAGITEVSKEQQLILAEQFARAAKENGMNINICAENGDFSEFGIGRAACIDGGLIGELTGRGVKYAKDRGQRPECLCAASVDIGEYNTCANGCIYCYANHSRAIVKNNLQKHNPSSPLLTGEPQSGDIIIDKNISTNGIFQPDIFQ